MNATWLLKSSTLWTVLALSGLLSTCILLLAPDGLPSLRKRQDEMADQMAQLQKMRRANLELALEVRRLAAKDPELYEALARQQGLARPGETIYTFREPGNHR
jgi:cell division protein FtsB